MLFLKCRRNGNLNLAVSFKTRGGKKQDFRGVATIE